MVISPPQYGKNIPFFLQLFRLWALWLRHFVGYSFGTSRKKHQPFSMTQPFVFVTELSYSIFSFLSVIEISSFSKPSVFIESLFPVFPG